MYNDWNMLCSVPYGSCIFQKGMFFYLDLASRFTYILFLIVMKEFHDVRTHKEKKKIEKELTF